MDRGKSVESFLFWFLILASLAMIAACAPREDWGGLAKGVGEVQRHAR